MFNSELFLQGLLHLLMGIGIGVLGIYIAAWLIMKILGIHDFQKQVNQGNLSVAILGVSAMVAMALIISNAVQTTFALVGLLADHITIINILKIISYACIYLLVSFIVGANILVLGAKVFTRITKHIDEIQAIKDNNIAASLLLSTVLIVLALMASPGLEAMLTGLLPLPVLQADQLPIIQ